MNLGEFFIISVVEMNRDVLERMSLTYNAFDNHINLCIPVLFLLFVLLLL